MKPKVVDENRTEISVSYEVKLSGWTESQYFAKAPEDRICEFKDGDAIFHSPAKPAHQRIVRFLTLLLQGFGSERRRGEAFNGPATLRLREGLDREPDIFFISEEHSERIKASWIEGPPDFVVEVISDESRYRDVKEKLEEYEEHQVPEYWIVDNEREEVLVYRRDESGELRQESVSAGRLESSAVAGFWIDVSWLWQEPLPQETACLRQIIGEQLGQSKQADA